MVDSGANPYDLQLAIIQNIGIASDYTQEVLRELEKLTTFIVTSEADGIAAYVTLGRYCSVIQLQHERKFAGTERPVGRERQLFRSRLLRLTLAALAARRRRK